MNKCSAKVGNFARGAQEGHFSWENDHFPGKQQLLEESLITGNISINQLSQITGISTRQLRKNKKRLLQGFSRSMTHLMNTATSQLACSPQRRVQTNSFHFLRLYTFLT